MGAEWRPHCHGQRCGARRARARALAAAASHLARRFPPLSPAVDKTAVVWDSATGEPRFTYAYHSAPVLDVDWASDALFATASSDGLIHVCSVGGAAPVRTFAGHTDEVNAVRWSPSRGLLASASDDGTVRLWSSGGDGAPPAGAAGTLVGHRKPVYALAWAPTGDGTANGAKDALLARCGRPSPRAVRRGGSL
jgi:transducin (beta)-like 1